MSDLPFMPLWVSTYEAHTAHLSLCEDGAYNRLLRLCWRTPGGTIPADDTWVMRQMRVDAATFASTVKPMLDEFFKVRRGRYVNDKLKELFDGAHEKSERRRNAGRKGGEAKALKSKGSEPSNATAKPEHCSSKLELELHTELDDAKASEVSAPLIATPEPAPKKTRRREAPKVEAHFMADDWWPSEADFEWAADPRNTKGIELTREESENETHQCKRWFLDRRDEGNAIGKRPGHSRSWQSWLCRAAPDILRARPRAPVASFAGRANGTQFAPKISQHDAFALAALKASGARGDAGREPPHSNGAGPLFGPTGVEVLDFGDDRGAEARRAGGNREPASAIVLPLSAASGR